MMKYQVRCVYCCVHDEVLNYFSIVLAVRLLSNVSSARESDGFVEFTLISSFPSDDPFTVQVFTMERNRTTATSMYSL